MPRLSLVCLLLLLLECIAVDTLTVGEMSDYEGGSEEIDELNEMPLGFTQGLYPMTRNIGRSVTFTCSISGQAPLNLFIVHDRIATYNNNKNRKRRIYGDTIYDPTKPNELSVVYVIEETAAKQAGIYKCHGESGSGDIVVSTAELTLLDPCEGISCGYKEACVNNKGRGICTCDFDCEESADEDNAVCVDGITYSSLCHLTRSECRTGEQLTDGIERGRCPDQTVVTEASCSISGEGHVTKFNGDYFTFRGSCPYKMAEDTRKGVLVVYARTESCGDNNEANCLRSITIYVDRIYGFSIERGWLINDNGRSRNIQNGETLVLGGGIVSIMRVGKTMAGRIENNDIQFFYDGLNYFKLTVPFSHVDKQNDFGGFCGSIPVDYIPSTGRDISLLSDINMPALADIELCEPEFGSTECENVDQYENDVRNAFVNSAGLAECASVVSMETYISRAIQDTCSCALSQELNYCFCNEAFAYKEDCRQAGVEVSIEEDICAKSFHQDAFKSEGISYKRYRKWYARKNI